MKYITAVQDVAKKAVVRMTITIAIHAARTSTTAG